MATDAEAAGDGAEEREAGADGVVEEAAQEGAEPGGAEAVEDFPHFVEIFNDYDPSQRFTAIFPVGEKEGATGSSVAYYIIEPGRHTGLHSDNVEEVAFVAEGEGEVFSIGVTERLEAGKFIVFPAGSEHDVYAVGSVALRVLSFFPTSEILTTFQQVVYPVAGNVVSSRPPQPLITELDPNNLPEDFPFDLAELGMAEEQAPSELSMTQRLIGMTDPNTPPENLDVRVYTPGEDAAVEPGPGQDEKRAEE